MFNLRVMATIIVAAAFVGPLTSESSAGRFWDLTYPLEDEVFPASANISVAGKITSNDPGQPANNLTIIVRIRNVASGQTMQTFQTTSTGSSSYAEFGGELEENGWTEGDAVVEVLYDGVVRDSVPVTIEADP